MQSVMKHAFSQAPQALISRSKFDRSCGYKTTFDSGYLIPFYWDEILPGDTFTVDATIFARLSTPIVPIMDNIFLDTFFFFVPNRLVWDNWEKFCGQQENPGDSTDFVTPYVSTPVSGFESLSLFDYFSLPILARGHQTAETTRHPLDPVAFYFRAYNLVWNEWFRDENLQDSVPVPKDDGPDSAGTYKLLRRGKRHDYFTSCLPWPQKSPGVEVPFAGIANVYGYSSLSNTPSDGLKLQITTENYDVLNPAPYYSLFSSQTTDSGANPLRAFAPIGWSATTNGKYLNVLSKESAQVNGLSNAGLYADLSDASIVSINTLREAFALQQYFEIDARGGTRYTEKVRAHFGVISPDARLQRPEYLGGSSNRINVYPVAQTSSTDTESPQGNLAAFGVSSSTGNGFVKSFTEHGVVIGLVSVRCDLTYQQGLDRHFSRRTVTDYYWPSFANLGEQAVLNKEIYAYNASISALDDVFGYQERYAEYRYKPSYITGKFRSVLEDSLDVWHLSQFFESTPTLNSLFIEEHPPLERVLAVQSEPQLLFDSYIKNICIRPMPMYSIPGLKKL